MSAVSSAIVAIIITLSGAGGIPMADLLHREPRLYINSTVNSTDFVEIIYEVNSPGFIELHLFDKAGKKIWIKGKVTDKAGADAIKIPRKPLVKDDRYTFVLKYKGKDYNGSFYAP
ncbi:MAG: hypothetical protein SF053_07190 [Bacteroidia bacterium]|nr:hypothetical protein [Bacteroidia bacterium]